MKPITTLNDLLEWSFSPHILHDIMNVFGSNGITEFSVSRYNLRITQASNLLVINSNIPYIFETDSIYLNYLLFCYYVINDN